MSVVSAVARGALMALVWIVGLILLFAVRALMLPLLLLMLLFAPLVILLMGLVRSVQLRRSGMKLIVKTALLVEAIVHGTQYREPI